MVRHHLNPFSIPTNTPCSTRHAIPKPRPSVSLTITVPPFSATVCHSRHPIKHVRFSPSLSTVILTTRQISASPPSATSTSTTTTLAIYQHQLLHHLFPTSATALTHADPRPPHQTSLDFVCAITLPSIRRPLTFVTLTHPTSLLSYKALVDSAATVNIIHDSVLDSIPSITLASHQPPTISTATGRPHPASTWVSTKWLLSNNQTCDIRFATTSELFTDPRTAISHRQRLHSRLQQLHADHPVRPYPPRVTQCLTTAFRPR